MKGRVAYLVGIVAGAAFIAGWVFDPGAQTTMVTALVCGIAAALGQLSTRDFLARAQQLIDRGIDEVYADGGELLSQARVIRERIDRFALTALGGGVLAPFFGTLRTIYAVPIWSAAAFACAVGSVILAVVLFAANREFGALLEIDRLNRAKAKQLRETLADSKAKQPVSQATDPNLMGYGSGGVARPL